MFTWTLTAADYTRNPIFGIVGAWIVRINFAMSKYSIAPTCSLWEYHSSAFQSLGLGYPGKSKMASNVRGRCASHSLTKCCSSRHRSAVLFPPNAHWRICTQSIRHDCTNQNRFLDQRANRKDKHQDWRGCCTTQPKHSKFLGADVSSMLHQELYSVILVSYPL